MDGETNLRLDKFLKVSRLIKRRTVANKACAAGKVLVNNKVCKASHEVKFGDIISILISKYPTKVRVISPLPYASKSNVNRMYEIIK